MITADTTRENNVASCPNKTNHNNAAAGEARYFGEYRESQGCFNSCLSGNDDDDDGRNEIFQPQHYNTNVANNATLSQDKDELKETKEFLALEFNKLSFQERAKALEDVHCVGPEASALGALSEQPPSNNDTKLMPTPDHSDWPRHPLHSNHLNFPDLEPLPKEEQDPRHLNQLFNEFEELVQKENNSFYNMAALQNPEYLKDPVLRLMFLRANDYKPTASVKQLMKMLKHKAEYFGKDTLGRDIKFDDMTEEDKRMMKSGLYHIQATRDKSGRVVVYMLNHCFGQFDAATIIRVTYYVWFQILIRMPGVQTKGMTACYYDCVPPGEEFTMPSIGFIIPLVSFANTLPFRYSSMHFCVKNTTASGNAVRVSLNNSALTLLTRGFPHYSRVRMKIHTGSDMELLYQLQSYGIDLKTFPVDVRTGRVKPYEVLNKWYYDYHHERLQPEERKQHSNTATTSASHFDDFDLDKTLDALVDAEEGMEAKVIERRALGGNDAELLDDLSIDWDIDLLKGDCTIDEGAQDERLRSSAQNTGWIQTLARDAFGFGADDVAVNHHAQDPPKHVPGVSSTISPAFGLSTTATVRTPAARPLSGAPGQTAQRPGSNVPLLDIVEPAPEDILLGRGKNVQYHSGNVSFRQWMEEFREEYESSPRYKKTQIAAEMIQILNSNGIRFLKQGQDKKSWVVADSKEAEEKIKQLFRSRRKKQRE